MNIDKRLLGIFKINNKEVFNYIVFGILTTIVNYIIYFYLSEIKDINYLIANIVAWTGAVSFSYITNKFYVFDVKILASVLVVILNYFFGKYFIFTKETTDRK